MKDLGYEKSAFLYDIFDNKDNIPFFLKYATQYQTMIDLGAGTGRIAIPIAQSGKNVICVEPSESMRAELQKKIKHHPGIEEHITIIPDSAVNFKYAQSVNFIYMSAAFDHFLTREERINSLENIHKHLNQNGIFLFDVFLGLMENSPLKPAGSYTIDGKTYKRFIQKEIVPEKQIITYFLVFEIYEQDRLITRIEQESQSGIIDYDTVRELLNITGFKLLHEFSDYQKTPFKSGDEYLIVEAKKK